MTFLIIVLYSSATLIPSRFNVHFFFVALQIYELVAYRSETLHIEQLTKLKFQFKGTNIDLDSFLH